MSNRDYYKLMHDYGIYSDDMIYEAVGNRVLSEADYEYIMGKPYVKKEN